MSTIMVLWESGVLKPFALPLILIEVDET